MNKFSNIMWFISKLAWSMAVMGKALVQPFKMMVEANKRDQLIKEIDEALGAKVVEKVVERIEPKKEA